MRSCISRLFLLFVSAALLGANTDQCFAQNSGADTKSSATAPLSEKSNPSDPPGTSDYEGCKLGHYEGTTPLSETQFYFKGVEDFRGGMTCIFHIGAKLPAYRFRFAGLPDNSFGNIDISEANGAEVIQTIESSVDPSGVSPRDAASVLTVVDANFDGYKDLQILSNCGATGNCAYDFYLYDPAANQFVHNDFLSNLGTPTFDEAKKQVNTSSNGSASDWQKETYQFEDGRYTLIHREESSWDRDKRSVTVNTYELQNGKMELVDSETTPLD